MTNTAGPKSKGGSKAGSSGATKARSKANSGGKTPSSSAARKNSSRASEAPATSTKRSRATSSSKGTKKDASSKGTSSKKASSEKKSNAKALHDKAPSTSDAPPSKSNGARPTLVSAHEEKPIPTDRKSDLKAQFAKLSTATNEISGLRRSIQRNFYDVGTILNRIREERLYEIKGYGSFESFVEREIDINKAVCLRSARIAEAIRRDDAVAAGLERASAAVAALDGEAEAANVRPAGSPVGAVPLHKQ